MTSIHSHGQKMLLERITGRQSVICVIGLLQLFLFSLQLGLVPPLRGFWGFNLWQYLPLTAQLAFSILTVLLCFTKVRAFIINALSRISITPPLSHKIPITIVSAIGIAAILWLLRERFAFGDAGILLTYYTLSGVVFVIKEMGTSFLIAIASTNRSVVFGLNPAETIQLMICFFGSATILLIIKISTYLAPRRETQTSIAAMVIAAGLLRICAGHLEVYAIVLCAGTAYLLAALAYLRNQIPYRVPCLLLGVGIWVHLVFLCLIPSLILLARLAPPSKPPRYSRLFTDLSLLAAPSLLFLTIIAAMDQTDSLNAAKWWIERMLGLLPNESEEEIWMFLEPGKTKMIADFGFLSLGHIKYLINAFYLLAPFTLPILAGIAAFAPGRLVRTRESRFLTFSCIPLIGYALLLRPYWGPYDWDLFSLTSLFLTFLAAHVSIGRWHERSWNDLSVWLVGSSHLFVTIPLLWIGIAVSHPVGPFVHKPFDPKSLQPGTQEYRDFDRWR